MTPPVASSTDAPAFLDEARRYRALGGERGLLVDYLQQCGLDLVRADQLADRFDLELCLAGTPRPHDVSALVAQQLDAHQHPSPVTPPRAEVPAPADAPPDTKAWDETTEFGYQIAQTWDDDDPNAAINQAASLARAGKMQEEIIEYLLSCQVSQGEAEYVASMSGARRANPVTPAGAKQKRGRSRGRELVLASAMILTGTLIAYLGYVSWDSGSIDGNRSPLSLVAVGGAIVLNGIRTLVRR